MTNIERKEKEGFHNRKECLSRKKNSRGGREKNNSRYKRKNSRDGKIN